MQERPTKRSADAKRQHASATSATASMSSPIPFSSFMNASSSASTGRMYGRRRGLFLGLVLPGICLEGLYLVLSLLLAGDKPEHDPLFQAWQAFLPWLPQWRWTLWLPGQQWLHLGWFDPATVVGNANLLLLVLCLVLSGLLLAARVGRLQRNMSPHTQRTCIRLIFSFAALFALTILLSPPHVDIFSRDMLLSWLAGRMVVVYHVNPYIAASTAYPHDVTTTLLATFPSDVANLPDTSGPVAIDLGILVSLLGHDQLVATVLSFRILGLLLHLGNALLIWLILRRSKPEMSILGLVLYAWNPLFLLLGVAQMHQELILVFFVLLTIYFLQRDACVLSWFFLLLAALTNPVCLLLLPLFWRMIMRKTRFLASRERFFLWLALLLLSPIVLVLAYLPYWDGLGWNGLVTTMSLVFLPSHALNSLDSLLLSLPFLMAIAKLFNPVYWSEVLLGFMGVFLLFSCWLADTVDGLLLCASWLLLIFLIFQPLYWPWYMFLPLTLVLCSTHGRTLLLANFLLIGALFSYYCWSRVLDWDGQAILVLGLPCLLWGWCVLFLAAWQMMLKKEEALAEAYQQAAQRPRPPWLSRPSWSSRPGRIRQPRI